MTLNNKTSENIIKETMKLVQKKGYAGTSIAEIIKKSKSPKGSMYYYFPKGKDDIIVSSLDRIDVEFRKKFKTASSACNSLEDVLSGLMNLFKNKEKVYGTPSFRMTLLALETIGQAPVVAEKCKSILMSWKELLANEIAAYGFEEEISKRLAEWFFTILQGAVCASVVEHDTRFMIVTEQSIKMISKLDKETIKTIF